MNKQEAYNRLDAIEREAKELREIIEAEDKPLAWPELPEGAYFKYTSGDFLSDDVFMRATGDVYFLIGDKTAHVASYFGAGQEFCVARVNFNGTPYKGDPRK